LSDIVEEEEREREEEGRRRMFSGIKSK